MSQTRLNSRQANAEGAGNVSTDSEVSVAITASLATASADATTKANAAQAAAIAASNTGLANKPNWSDVGAPNGLASLNSSGQLLVGQIPALIRNRQIAAISGTTLIPYDNTTPLVTEGTEIVNVVINPYSNTSKLIINGSLQIDCSVANRNFTLSLFRNNVCIGAISRNFVTIARPDVLNFNISDLTLGTLFGNNVTYSLRVGLNAAATWYVNRAATAVLNGMQNFNSVTFTEFN